MLRHEWPLLGSIATTALLYGQSWLADLSNPVWFAFILGWLFCVILLSAFAVVRHVEGLAVRLGEPLGTLVLTLSVTGMEVAMIATVMYTGYGNSSLARDTMFAVVMIVLNGMVGFSLLLGGLRYHEQTYNLHGAVSGRDRTAGSARIGSAELHRVVRRPDVFTTSSHLSHRHVNRTVWRVSGDPDPASS
jgi:Ca2+:H+ antiporter